MRDPSWGRSFLDSPTPAVPHHASAAMWGMGQGSGPHSTHIQSQTHTHTDRHMYTHTHTHTLNSCIANQLAKLHANILAQVHANLPVYTTWLHTAEGITCICSFRSCTHMNMSQHTHTHPLQGWVFHADGLCWR